MGDGVGCSVFRKKHANIPVFIPHLGCPNQCVFCDQRFISGTQVFCESDVAKNVENALSTIRTSGKEAEIAFFGGSFTGIDRDLMIRLLDTTQEYVDSGEVTGIRLSTRPDYISAEIIDVLKRYSISQVELGIQSMSDRVLLASKRGHTSGDTERACGLLCEAGIPFVGHMMVGLPGALPEDEVSCAEQICNLGAAGTRIYPTIVFRNTELCEMTKRGEYTPLTIDEAVERSADVLEVFAGRGVPCLRIGLCESEALHDEGKYYAGPAHPALGEAVRGQVYRRRAVDAAEGPDLDGKTVEVTVPQGDVSAFVGLSGSNREYLQSRFNIKKMKFKEDPELGAYQLKLSVSEHIKNR